MNSRLLGVGLTLFAVLVVGGSNPGSAAASVFTPGPSAGSIHGAQTATHKITLEDNSNLSLTCTTATFTGSLPGGGTKQLVVHPIYEGCTAFGLSATVITTGCDYELHAGTLSGGVTPVSMDIECGSGAIVITTLTCEVKIKTQQGLVEAVAVNTSLDVDLDTTLSGMSYEVTKDGIGCPLKAVGSYTKALYTGSTTFTSSTGFMHLN